MTRGSPDDVAVRPPPKEDDAEYCGEDFGVTALGGVGGNVDKEMVFSLESFLLRRHSTTTKIVETATKAPPSTSHKMTGSALILGLSDSV